MIIRTVYIYIYIFERERLFFVGGEVGVDAKSAKMM